MVVLLLLLSFCCKLFCAAGHCEHVIRGEGRYFCPCSCKTVDELHSWPTDPRKAARICPDGTLERQRFLCSYWEIFFEEFGVPKRVLHIAAEDALVTYLRGRFPSIDIVTGKKNIKGSGVYKGFDVDVQAIPFPENFFDLVICNHVIEHVANDTLALSEFYRVLRPGGVGFISTPLHSSIHREDPTIVTASDRLRAYFQADHVRLYSKDVFIARSESVGFKVDLVSISDFYRSQFPELSNLANPEYEIGKSEVFPVMSKPFDEE